MKNKRLQKRFLAELAVGNLRVIDKTTHPFAMNERIDTCCRCGVVLDLDNDAQIFSAVAYLDEVDEESARVVPFILLECEDCMALPEEERSNMEAGFASA